MVCVVIGEQVLTDLPDRKAKAAFDELFQDGSKVPIDIEVSVRHRGRGRRGEAGAGAGGRGAR